MGMGGTVSIDTDAGSGAAGNPADTPNAGEGGEAGTPR
jgi:hypothetical protein